jgi:hypothetical protein
MGVVRVNSGIYVGLESRKDETIRLRYNTADDVIVTFEQARILISTLNSILNRVAREEREDEGQNENEYIMTNKEIVNNMQKEFEDILYQHEKSCYNNSNYIMIDKQNIQKYLDWIKNSTEE